MQPHKRQFKGTTKPRLFFDRKLRQTGSTLSLSVGKVLPHNWYYVRLTVIEQDANEITLKITKLLEHGKNAQRTENNPRSKQNT